VFVVYVVTIKQAVLNSLPVEGGGAMGDRNDHVDRTILLLKRKLQEKQRSDKWYLGSKAVIVRQESIGGGLYMKMPTLLADMDPVRARIIFPRRDRPTIIKTDKDNNATLTIKLVPRPDEDGEWSGMPDKETGRSAMSDVDVEWTTKKISDHLAKVHPQNVFYEHGIIKGRQGDFSWFDFKGFGIERMYYGLIFVGVIDRRLVIGNFHCTFADYVKWKPLVMAMIESVGVCDQTYADIGKAGYRDEGLSN
jgi:hypothetical protein